MQARVGGRAGVPEGRVDESKSGSGLAMAGEGVVGVADGHVRWLGDGGEGRDRRTYALLVLGVHS